MASSHEGNFTLNGFSISTPNGSLDLTPYAIKCDIYESILASSVICEITLSDSTGMLDAFDFTEECVCISFSTYDEYEPVHYEVKVVQINPIKSTPNDKNVVFVMTCLSEEILKSKTLKNIPLVRKKIESEKIVKSMLNLTETKKNLHVEKTKGIHSFGLTNITPFDAIDRVRRTAVSEKYNSSSFVFFENRDGYHFKTIEKLIDDGNKKIGDKFFIHTTLAGVDVSGTKWRNIIAYKVVQSGNQSVGLLTGGYSNSVRRYNLETGELELYEKPSKNVDFVSLNEGSVSTSLTQQNERSKDEGKITLNLFNPDQENNQLAEKHNFLPYYLTKFLTIISHITIYGDSTITIGDVITCKLPKINGLTNESYKEDSSIYSGNYLVCKCRHVLTFGDSPKYYQALEIVKDGMINDDSTSGVNFT